MPGGNDPINFGLADFGGDGRVEIYCKDEIFNAHTGARLRASTFQPLIGEINRMEVL